jgi:hypothetical protein
MGNAMMVQLGKLECKQISIYFYNSGFWQRATVPYWVRVTFSVRLFARYVGQAAASGPGWHWHRSPFHASVTVTSGPRTVRVPGQRGL